VELHGWKGLVTIVIGELLGKEDEKQDPNPGAVPLTESGVIRGALKTFVGADAFRPDLVVARLVNRYASPALVGLEYGIFRAVRDLTVSEGALDGATVQEIARLEERYGTSERRGQCVSSD